jgi:PAS domain S-box-containing protein
MGVPIKLPPEEYAILVEQAPILIWRAGTDALCDYFNDRWLAFTGRTLQQELGNGWADGVHTEDLERCLAIYVEAFAKREIFEMEYRLRRKDGQFRWIHDRGVPVHDEEGNFTGFIGSCIDVTERVEAQEAQVRMLHGLLPICMTCKKIKDDDGYWQSVEKYIQEHSQALFSHGFCPECARKYYDEQVRILGELDR